jgi:hypothetical protein
LHNLSALKIEKGDRIFKVQNLELRGRERASGRQWQWESKDDPPPTPANDCMGFPFLSRTTCIRMSNNAEASLTFLRKFDLGNW